MYPIYYNEPKLNIECDKKTVYSDDTINCKLYLEYNYDVKKIKFNLAYENFNMLNIKGLNQWENSLENDSFILDNKKDINTNQKKATIEEIAEFNLKTAILEKNIDIVDNIKVNNINYIDIFISNKILETSATVNVLKKNVNEIKEEENLEKKDTVEEKSTNIENPPTGTRSLVLDFIILGFIGLFIYVFYKKYSVKKM